MCISPLYHSLVIICLFIYSYIFYHYHYYLFVFLFLFSFFFVLFFSINCFYLFNYLFFSSSFLLLFIGLAYCVSTTIQVFLLASKFNINIKYSIKNIIWLYSKTDVNFIMAKSTFTYFWLIGIFWLFSKL